MKPKKSGKNSGALKKKLDKLKSTPGSMRWVFKYGKPYYHKILVLTVIGMAVSALSTYSIENSRQMLNFAQDGDFRSAALRAGVFVAINLFNIIVGAFSNAYGIRISESLQNYMRRSVFEKLYKSKWQDISKYHSEDIMTRITSDVGQVASVVTEILPNFVQLIFSFVLNFCYLLALEPRLAILAFVLGPSTVLFGRFWGRKLKPIQLELQKSESAYRAFMQESVSNLTVVKVFGMEDESSENINRLYKNRLFWVLKKNFLGIISSSIMSLGYMGGYLGGFVWGAFMLTSGRIQIGTMLAFTQLVSRVQAPFMALSKTVPQLITITASVDRLREIQELPSDDYDTTYPVPEKAGLLLKNISFSYSEERVILKNADLTVSPGDVCAITGGSGEGKTTLIRLIMALLYPDNGNIYFTGDGEEKLPACASTRQWISYVPQGNTLFSGTIRYNLMYGNKDATEEEIIEACKAANIWQYIEILPKGLNTVIGERGHGLSEGQAQRIAIARAILRKTPILILDEATSALDHLSETRVLAAIRKLPSRPTCLVITHRTTALEICTRVLHVENGVISDITKPSECKYSNT